MKKTKTEFSLVSSEKQIMELLWEADRNIPSKEILDYFNNNYEKEWKKQKNL